MIFWNLFLLNLRKIYFVLLSILPKSCAFFFPFQFSPLILREAIYPPKLVVVNAYTITLNSHVLLSWVDNIFYKSYLF